uniref:Putative secreted protein n=1 Tax=Anopheles darlingi TaxID=43151 RepID=A0A2M4D9H9_ANODA
MLPHFGSLVWLVSIPCILPPMQAAIRYGSATLSLYINKKIHNPIVEGDAALRESLVLMVYLLSPRTREIPDTRNVISTKTAGLFSYQHQTFEHFYVSLVFVPRSVHTKHRPR